jgi:hypothetical protein
MKNPKPRTKVKTRITRTHAGYCRRRRRSKMSQFAEIVTDRIRREGRSCRSLAELREYVRFVAGNQPFWDGLAKLRTAMRDLGVDYLNY